MRAVLCARLAEALDRVVVDRSCRSAVLDEDEVTASGERELIRKLANLLYRRLHTGSEGRHVPLRRNLELERELAEAVPAPTTIATVLVREVLGDGLVVVEREGVRVLVPQALVAGPPGAMVSLTVSASRPALSPGFFLVRRQGTRSGPVLRGYVHQRDAVAVVPTWRKVLNGLDQVGASYSAKILSNPAYLPRRDGLVVYFDAADAGRAMLLPEILDGCPGLGKEVSVFTASIGPGIAVAWEPDDPRPGMRELSFGQHRATAVATGLVRHAGASSSATRIEYVARALREASIDPVVPARNLNSPTLPGQDREAPVERKPK